MAKKCNVERVKRCTKLISRYESKRQELVAVVKNPESTPDERVTAYRKLARIPRDSSKTRKVNRCELTGRPRAFMRKFRLSRIAFRELALEGKIPGVTKSSW